MPTDSRRPERLFKIHKRHQRGGCLWRYQHRGPDTRPEARRTNHRGDTGTTHRLDEPRRGTARQGGERGARRGRRDVEHGICRLHKRHIRGCAGRPQHAALLCHHEPRDRTHRQELPPRLQRDSRRLTQRGRREREPHLLHGERQRQVPRTEAHRRLLPTHIRHHLLPHEEGDTGGGRQAHTRRLQRRVAARRPVTAAARPHHAEVSPAPHTATRGNRRGSTRTRRRRPDTCHKLRTARRHRELHPPLRTNRPRRQEGHVDKHYTQPRET